MAEINIYCDESCHLENDDADLMTLGAVWCLKDKVKEISDRVQDIKKEYGLNSSAELKWTKISPAKKDMYLKIIDYFFDDDDLHYRGLVATEKNNLNHEKWEQSHDEWYYKMYYELIHMLLSSGNKYNIFLDRKDSSGSLKVKNLHDILARSKHDFNKNMVQNVEVIISHMSTCLQISDIFSGALGYVNRGLTTSSAKLEVIEKIKKRSGFDLKKSTLPSERKFNVFIWAPSK